MNETSDLIPYPEVPEEIKQESGKAKTYSLRRKEPNQFDDIGLEFFLNILAIPDSDNV